MKPALKKVLRNIAAVLLAILGVLGLFLPFLQGILLLVAAFSIADFEKKHLWMRWLLSRRLARRFGGEKLRAKLARRPAKTPRPAG